MTGSISDPAARPAPFAFIEGALDRADALRDDPAALAALWPQARVVLLDDDGRALADAAQGLLVGDRSAVFVAVGEAAAVAHAAPARHAVVHVDQPLQLGAFAGRHHLGQRERGGRRHGDRRGRAVAARHGGVSGP